MRMWDVVANRFGSKRGLLAYLVGQLGLLLGRYRVLQSPEWSRIKRVVFVCHGNICRSAMGDAVARKLGVPSASCGLHACPGRPADPRAVEFATRYGMNLNDHQSMRLDQIHFSATDLVVAMEPLHIEGLQGMVGNAQLTLLGLWLPTPLAYLHDPYNASAEYFERCMGMVELATTNLAAHLPPLRP